jgi:hypothetical protein
MKYINIVTKSVTFQYLQTCPAKQPAGAEVGKVTFKINGDEALSDESV